MFGLPNEILRIILNFGAHWYLGDLIPFGLVLLSFVEQDVSHNEDVNAGHASHPTCSLHIADDSRLLQIHLFEN